MRRQTIRPLILIPLILLISGTLFAEPVLYEYVDENGVVSYTNKLENVPEPGRSAVRIIERSDLPPLATVVRGDPAPAQPMESWLRIWVESVWFKASVVSGILALAVFAATRFGAGTVLLGWTGRILLFAFLAAAVHGIFQAYQYASDRKMSSIGSHLKPLSPVETTRQAAEAFQNRVDEQQEHLDSIDDTR